MTPEVITLLRRLEPQLRPFERVALLSPSREERALLPGARVLERGDWDLDERRRDLRFDLIIACHVFHYAAQPERWLAHARASCRALLMLDLVQRKRSVGSELGPDGDRMRYAIGPHRPEVAQFYDLNSFGAALLAHHVFAGEPNQYGPAKHLLALIRGELDGPLIRIDGYPASDVGQMGAVLEGFAQPGPHVVLGVTPARVDAALLAQLRAMPWLECALAGHAATDGDEFRWMRQRTIEGVLRADRERIEAGLGRPVRSYAAPGDRVNRRTARALRALGFELCLCDGSLPRRTLPALRSDFHGRSGEVLPHEAQVGGAPEVIRLDLRQECQGSDDGLRALREGLALQRTAAGVKIDALAQACAGL